MPSARYHPLYSGSPSRTQGDVVALVYAGNRLAHLRKHVQKGAVNRIPDKLHAKAGNLHGQNIAVAVDREPRHHVRLPVDKAAAGKVRPGHDGPAVPDGVLRAAAPEARVKHVVGVAGDEPDGDFAQAVVKARPHIGVAGKHVHQPAVLKVALRFADFLPVYPRVPVLDAALGLGRYCDFRIRPLYFHCFTFKNCFRLIVTCFTSAINIPARGSPAWNDFAHKYKPVTRL